MPLVGSYINIKNNAIIYNSGYDTRTKRKRKKEFIIEEINMQKIDNKYR